MTAVLVSAVLAASTLAGCSATVTGAGRAQGAPTVAATGVPLGEQGADGTAAFAQMVADMQSLEHGFSFSFGDEASSGLSVVSRYQGTNGTSRVTYGGVRGDLVAVDGDAWAKAPASFWEQIPAVDATVRAQISDRWVTVTGPIDAFVPYVSQAALFDGIGKAGPAVLGPVSTRDGVAVHPVRLGEQSEVLVTLASPHLLVQWGDVQDSSFTFPTGDLEVTAPSDPVAFPS